MIFYCIQHIPSGGYLPYLGRRRGHSYVEPTNDRPPRLFKTYNYAKFALDWWLKGKWKEHSYQGYNGDYDIDLINIPQENRKTEDMRIVKVMLSKLK